MISKEKFISDTSKFFSTGRSEELVAIDDAIGDYHRDSTPFNAKKLADAIIAWAAQKGLKTNGDINTGRNATVINQLVQDAHRLPGAGKLKDLPAAVRAARLDQRGTGNGTGGGGVDPLRWVNDVESELKKFSTYACMDCMDFDGCINSKVKMDVLNRRLEAIARGGKPPMPPVIAKGEYEWKSRALQLRYNYVISQPIRQAECTTFGYLAAYVLTKNRAKGPKVELVAHMNGRGSHVYVLVGREGSDPLDGRIPDNWDAVVVDGWAASLGHACVYPNRRAFERVLSMTRNLELVMARPATL